MDENWSAAEVNARWGKRAVLTDGSGRVLDHAVLGARGMTDAGAREVFFEFNALEQLPRADVSGRRGCKGEGEISQRERDVP